MFKVNEEALTIVTIWICGETQHPRQECGKSLLGDGRYHSRSSVVSSADYHFHDWAPDFRSAQTEAKSEVEKQIETGAADCETKQRNFQSFQCPTVAIVCF
jgi:hypothetical protein